MTLAFTADDGVQRLVLGRGVRHRLAGELARLGARHPLILASPSAATLASQLAAGLEAPPAGSLAEARAHVPLAAVDEAAARAAEGAADALLAVGGGAATGLAKAVAVRTGLPIVAVPTTLAGSEATPVWAVSREGVKRTARDALALPRVVLADPEAGAGLPAEALAASGLNALAHALAAYDGPEASPASRLPGGHGAALLLEVLTAAVAGDPDARAHALWATQLTARGFALAGAAAHHRACHALGGALAAPHAATHAALLPHALAALPEPTARRLAADLGLDDVAEAVAGLAARLGAPTLLPVAATEAERAVDVVVEATAGSWEPDVARHATRAALAGAPPRRR
ncbi:MAG: iron-containing alcohol dehydrogenase [Egibacteraceae bacterium]